MAARDTDVERFAKQRIGRVLRGKYRLDALLGVGGMAAVYKATHRNQAEFAVKVLAKELSSREDVRTRFLREGYAANSVKHPGAVLVVDDDVDEDGAAFLVMELLDGVDAENLLWQGPSAMGPLEASSIVFQLLDVLTAAHAKGIVHRDIKPANLFVMRDGTVKVLDFGIARARDAASIGAADTGNGLLLGTPAFMPPEQALAQPDLVDGRTDVWAAGATLFSLVSRQYVHEGDNGPQLMVRAATAHARPVSTVAENLPLAIARVVDRALRFDKAARWSTAAAMRDALGAACEEVYGQRPSKGVLAAALALAHIGHASTAPPSRPSTEELAPTIESTGTERAGDRLAPLALQAVAREGVGRPNSPETTAQPLASDPSEGTSPPRRTSFLAAAVSVSALAALAGVYAMNRLPAEPHPAVATPTAPAVPAGAAPEAPQDSAPIAIAVSATAPAGSAPSPADGGASSRRPAGAHTGPKPAPPPKDANPVKPNPFDLPIK
jgi:serine/threonine-protein kinase